MLNKNVDDLKTILGTIKTNEPNYNLWIVNYHDNAAANEKDFVTDFTYQNESGKYDSHFKKGYADIAAILQGEIPDGIANNHANVQSYNKKFFFSDNMLNDKDGTDKYRNDRSIRINVHYSEINGKQTIDAVRIKINRGSSKATSPTVYNYYRELDVKVGIGKEWKQTIAGEPGAINLDESNKVDGTHEGIPAWYDFENW